MRKLPDICQKMESVGKKFLLYLSYYNTMEGSFDSNVL